MLCAILFPALVTTAWAGQPADQDASVPDKTVSTQEGEASNPDGSNQKDKKPKKVKAPNRGRILPIPIFITEPAVGEGLGVALA